MRLAFLMGSNGPADSNPLSYAREDAERMKDCLSGARCGFEVRMPEPGADTFEVRRQLTIIAESCTPEDTFVCYFSGHGTLEKGSLVLLWDNTQLDRPLSTALPVSDILQVLKHCKARSRLLILDCCHAGAVATTFGLKDASGVPVQELEISPDNYYVLMASDRLETARELETLQGSFLTMNIVAALEERFAEADKDEDGRISMQDLHQWLEDRAKIHNQLYPNTRVSYPYLLGKQKGEFYLTLAASAWTPYELNWPDGSTMVLLPIHPFQPMSSFWADIMFSHWPAKSDDTTFTAVCCISKNPITNAQYKRFVEDGGGKEPVGELYASQFKEASQDIAFKRRRAGSWQGPFYPWHAEEFRDPEKPVVCVSYDEAIAYCDWVNNLNKQYESYTLLPDPRLWDFAALGTPYSSYNPDITLIQNKKIHHKSSAPVVIDSTGARSNVLGVSDLLGNVWEWCIGNAIYALLGADNLEIQVRGGGFLDDLSKVQPVLSASNLKDLTDTRHFDLGFRISAIVSIENLPTEVQQRLLTTRFLP